MIVHEPQTDEGRSELKKQVAAVHADMIQHRLRQLNCPAGQRAALLDAVIRLAGQKGSSPGMQTLYFCDQIK